MRPGRGKGKGGHYEHVVAKKISASLSKFGILEDDCYRTKNSGATKAQPADLQLSPALAKIFPATVECKHYRKIEYKLGKSLASQPKSYVIREWWKQVQKEEKQAGNKFGLLVMRENHCDDLVAFSPQKITSVLLSMNLPSIHFTRYTFRSLVITRYKSEEVWIVSLKEFLSKYALHLKWFVLFSQFDFKKGGLKK